MAQIFSLKNSKFFSGLKKICAIVSPITTGDIYIYIFFFGGGARNSNICLGCLIFLVFLGGKAVQAYV